MSDENERENTMKIRFLNDRFRQTFNGGKVLMTSGVSELPLSQQITLMNLVRTFDEFNKNNDPYGEPYFWKIDYYDVDFEGLSTDPTDETITNRVLTVMLAEEY